MPPSTALATHLRRTETAACERHGGRSDAVAPQGSSTSRHSPRRAPEGRGQGRPGGTATLAHVPNQPVLAGGPISPLATPRSSGSMWHIGIWHSAAIDWAVMATRTRTRAVGQLWAPTELREPMSRFGREIRASSGRACVNKPGQAKFVWAPHSRRVNAAHDTHRCDVRVGPWAACGSVQPRHGRLRCATKRLIKAIPAAAASSARPSSP